MSIWQFCDELVCETERRREDLEARGGCGRNHRSLLKNLQVFYPKLSKKERKIAFEIKKVPSIGFLLKNFMHIRPFLTLLCFPLISKQFFLAAAIFNRTIFAFLSVLFG